MFGGFADVVWFGLIFVLWVYVALCLPGLLCDVLWFWLIDWCLWADCRLPLVGCGLRWLSCCCSLVFYAAAFLLRVLVVLRMCTSCSGGSWLFVVFCRFWLFCVGVLVLR